MPFTAASLSPQARNQFVLCALPLLQVIRQVPMDSPIHRKLLTLLWALPHLLLRVAAKDASAVTTSKIMAAASKFQLGQWQRLISDASPRRARNHQSHPLRPMDQVDKEQEAQSAIRAGSLHKARTILTSNGMAAGDQQTIDDLFARHPTSKHSPSTLPSLKFRTRNNHLASARSISSKPCNL
jgi:hypothetical protein